MNPASMLTPIAGYFALVGFTYLVFWKWGARVFASRRIQNPGKLDRAQIGREVRNALLTMLFSSAIPLLIAGGSRVQATVEGWAPWELAALFVVLLVLNDAWFYATHRLLHSPWLFKHVHSVHHRSIDVNPFSVYSFHPLEGILLTAWVIPVVLLFPIPLPLLGAMQFIGLLNNVNAHLGYELMPRWFVRIPPFSWFTSSTFHNQHHAQVTGNYGLMFRVWDRMLGSERVDYVQRFLTRGAQFMEGRTSASATCPPASRPPE